MNKKTQAAIAFIIVFLVALFATSCNSVKKSQQSSSLKKDSAAVEIHKATGSFTKDSIATSSSKTITDGNTIIEFDSDDDGEYYVEKSDSTRASDFIPTTRPPRSSGDLPTTIDLPGGAKVITNRKIKSITTSGTTLQEKEHYVEVNIRDTTAEESAKITTSSSEEKSASSSKNKKGWFAQYWWIGALIIAAFVFGFWTCWKYKGRIEAEIDEHRN
jgi:hypothetical protein